MKTGMTLVDMAQELERQKAEKRDFVADSRKLVMLPTARSMQISTQNGVEEFAVNDFAQGQIAERVKINKPFYDDMIVRHPDVLANVVNTLFQREPKRSMVRVLDGHVRAVKTDGFRPLDNYDLFDAIFPVLKEAGAHVESCALTERKLYIKCLCPWLDRELPMPVGLKMGVGHNFFARKVIGAVTISNSEIGCGSISIAPGLFEMQCTNLATYRDDGYRKIHVGKKQGSDDVAFEYLSDSTKRLEDAVVWAKVRDVLKATMDGRVIDAIVAKALEARTDIITGDPAKVVELFAKQNQLTDNERGGLLRHLTGSGEMTRYGLQWAVTRLAGEAEDYDRASDLERLGGQVIELPRTDWNVLAEAA